MIAVNWVDQRECRANALIPLYLCTHSVWYQWLLETIFLWQWLKVFYYIINAILVATELFSVCVSDSNLLVWGDPKEPPCRQTAIQTSYSALESWKPRCLSANYDKFTDLIEENSSICTIQCFESHVIVVCRSGHWFKVLTYHFQIGHVI